MQFTKHSVGLLSADLPAARDFYVQHLGLTASADLGWFVNLERKGDGVDFEMWLVDKDHEFTPLSRRAASAGTMLALQVDDCDATCETLRGAGVEILAEPVDEPWGQRHFIAAAPDGVMLDIYHMVPPDMQWLRDHGFA